LAYILQDSGNGTRCICSPQETPDDIALFAEKQTFMYAVLEAKVLTDQGKAIIRVHETDFDAQKVYQKIKTII
jgi:hypothetical protein